MRKVIAAVALAGASLMVSACSSTLKATELNTDGRFATGSQVYADGITVKKPYEATRYKKLVVMLPFTENKTINDFYFQSLVNSKKFDQVLDSAGVEKMVISQKIENVTDASSVLSLNKMAQTTGPFLIIKPYAEYKGGYNFIASIEAIDAESAEVVFRAEKKAFNWAGLDKPLFYPIFNALLDWIDGVPPRTAPVSSTTAK
jgi:hypothetical protein